VASFAIDTFVAECLDATRAGGTSAPVAVKEVLDRVLRSPTARAAAAAPPTDIAPFTTWHRSDELTVLHVVWPPSVDLLAHDHEMWATIGLYGGREDNRYYRSLPEGGLEPSGGTTLLGGDTVALGRDVIHAVANPSREWTAAIHVYGGDYFAPARRMWPDPATGPVDFDVATVIATLEAAVARSR
jgi:predicted metal-dependent enzyme (double-stranded beta helix superfamily)